MVLFHMLRCQRYLWCGLRDRVRVSRMVSGAAPLPTEPLGYAVVPVSAIRELAARAASSRSAAGAPPLPRVVWPWRRQLPHDDAFGKLIAQPTLIPMYCGLRTVDGLGHVNNAKYLEICEFARWHQMSFLGFGGAAARHGVAFVVSDLSISYVREIAPRSTVWVRTRFRLPPPPPSTPSSSTSATATSDAKRLYVDHEIWSKDGRRLHAVSTVAAALLGPVKFEEELARRFDPAGAAAAAAAAATAAGSSSGAKPTRKLTTLNCEHAIAEAVGLSSVAELRQLFASVDAPGSPIVPIASAASAESSGMDGDVQLQSISKLADVWRATRSFMRSRSLVAPPPPS